MKRRVGLAILLMSLIMLVLASLTAGAAGFRIALCNNYAGNTMRQSMIAAWELSAKEAVSEGLIAEAPVFTSTQPSAESQAALLQSLILKKYDAIVINSASSSSLNGIIKEAIDAGITVVSFDNNVTQEGTYNVITAFHDMGASELDYIHQRFPEGANVFEIRGMAGTPGDEVIHSGIADGFAKYANLKKVGFVYGDWTETVAQKAVAGIVPSLPQVDAIVTQGGDGYGAVQAFEAAGRKIPVVVMGNRYDELTLWKQLKDKDGYQTISMSTSPACSQVGFWVAYLVLKGEKVPHDLYYPTLTITSSNLDKAIADTPAGGTTVVNLDLSWVKQLVENSIKGVPAPPQVIK
jgi:ribose transport system substrate-binding protein